MEDNNITIAGILSSEDHREDKASQIFGLLKDTLRMQAQKHKRESLEDVGGVVFLGLLKAVDNYPLADRRDPLKYFLSYTKYAMKNENSVLSGDWKEVSLDRPLVQGNGGATFLDMVPARPEFIETDAEDEVDSSLIDGFMSQIENETERNLMMQVLGLGEYPDLSLYQVAKENGLKSCKLKGIYNKWMNKLCFSLTGEYQERDDLNPLLEFINIDKKEFTEKVALQNVRVFSSTSDRMIKNIGDMAEYFGFSPEEYVKKVGLKHPTLFTQNPQRMIHNIETVAKHFNIPIEEYKTNCILKEPRIMPLKPATTIEHANIISRLYKDGYIIDNKRVKFSKKKQVECALFLYPKCLAWSSSNLHLRRYFAELTGQLDYRDKIRPKIQYLTSTRKFAEAKVAAKLGYGDLPVGAGVPSSDAFSDKMMNYEIYTGLVKKGVITMHKLDDSKEKVLPIQPARKIPRVIIHTRREEPELLGVAV